MFLYLIKLMYLIFCVCVLFYCITVQAVQFFFSATNMEIQSCIIQVILNEFCINNFDKVLEKMKNFSIQY